MSDNVSPGRHTTVITGRNGSYKSSVLRAIVEAVTQPPGPSGYPFVIDGKPPSGEAPHVVACSGTATDRYPAKEMRGRPTIYDVPQYVYLGQRVGSNIISRKQALETAATHALNSDIRERFNWDFFEHAFEVVGVRPSVELSFRISRPEKNPKRTQAPLLDRVLWAESTAADLRRSEPPPGKLISPALAAYLLKTFSEDVFNALRKDIESEGRLPRLTLGTDLPSTSDKPKTDIYRLGLLADELTLIDAQLVSTRKGKSFSAFELSSGEYHLLTAYLGLGFSIHNDSIVLIDEPEVSLHPQWQVDFMRTVEGIASLAMSGNGHIVISTHSPLILSSAPLSSTVIDVDRAGEGTEARRSPVGAASDALLLDHFGVASGRNFFVVDKVQEAVHLLERGMTETPRLEQLRTDLREIRRALEKSDPFVDLIDAILEPGEAEAVR